MSFLRHKLEAYSESPDLPGRIRLDHNELLGLLLAIMVLGSRGAEEKKAKREQAAASTLENKRRHVEHKVGTRVVVEFMHNNEPTEFGGEIVEAISYGRYLVKFDDGAQLLCLLLTMCAVPMASPRDAC